MNWLLVSVFFIFQTKENMLFLNPLIDKSHKQLTSVLKPGAIKTSESSKRFYFSFLSGKQTLAAKRDVNASGLDL